MTSPCIVSASYRAQFLAVTILQGPQVLELRTFRIPSGAHLNPSILRHLADAVFDFDATMLVVEPDSPCSEVADALHRGPVKRLAFEEAKRLVLDEPGHQSHQQLFDALVARHPTLARFVRLLPTEGALRVASSERWRTNMLISVALGFAAVRLSELPTDHP